ncbi:MAG TPA: hypothetical protein VJG13_11660, partial [Thermoanaerobaculia bacterium]|nr:hypothetical protein [Thermoanaerobaculia bacterium]
MSLPIRLVAALALLGAPLAAEAPLDWRFGLEDTWAQLGGLLAPADAETLAAKMAALTAAQPAGGDVNVNGLAGGWAQMQAAAGAPIDFSQSDALVRLLQRHRFSMLWNLRVNAPWASAANPACYGFASLPGPSCAPDAAHEDDLYDYIRAVVERYDGDGEDDMGAETPGDPTDDLEAPVRFYLMTGEIELAGATPPPTGGYGDAATNHFWTDSIENLLRTHRIVYRAIHDADPSGATRLVSSGGVLCDLYADFPDWPAVEGPTVQARLAGANNHGASYVESHARLVEMLESFGDDSDGVEADYVGWHPHMPWREIEQTFAFIRAHAGAKPIYVDDMWANLFLQDRADAPGNTLFTGGGAAIEGDFPNPFIPTYAALRAGVLLNPAVRDWYHARAARQLVKAYAAAFGEGAERVSFSGNADFTLDRLLGITGFLNLMGTLGEGFAEKPAYWIYRMLVEKLHDFTCASELAVSADPRTRVYRFERPRGPLWIGWSETGGAPPGLDYDLPTGETVSFPVGVVELLRTR